MLSLSCQLSIGVGSTDTGSGGSVAIGAGTTSLASGAGGAVTVTAGVGSASTGAVSLSSGNSAAGYAVVLSCQTHDAVMFAWHLNLVLKASEE
jgi:hypothetical protein